MSFFVSLVFFVAFVPKAVGACTNARRGMPGGRVEQRAGPGRTSGAWWHADGSHWERDEWDVALSDGPVCRLYRDRETGKWFLEGVID